MITRGSCEGCGAALATDQRYCIECGTRVGPPMAMPYAPATPAEAAEAGSGIWAALPVPPQALSVAAALALGFGVVLGTALSPNLVPTLAGPLVVEEAPPPPPPPPDTGGGGGGGSGGGTQVAQAPAPDTLVTPAPVPDEGGEEKPSDGKTKKPKEKLTYLNGIVVHNNPVAGSYSIATGGTVSAIHARTLPPPGTAVRTPIELLANRTYNEAGKRQANGQRGEASFAGFVTDARDSTDPAVPDTYTLSVRGSSVLIHMPPDLPDDAVDQVPPPTGALATVTVEIRTPAAPTPKPVDPAPPVLACTPPQPPPFPAPPVVPPKELHQKALSVEAPEVTSVEVETVVQAVCPVEGQVLVSADDIREGGVDVLLAPVGIDAARLAQGEPIIASVKVEPVEGVNELTQLTGVLSDRGVAGANNESAAQGDL